MTWLARAVGWLVILGVLGAAVLAVFVLPRDDRVPADADAVVVLGGAGGERTELGIEIADELDVPLVLSSNAAFFGQRQGRACGDETICFEPDPENTAGEAANVAEMAAEQGWDHVVVATSRFHTSRSRLLFNQCLGGDRVSVVGSTAPSGAATTPRLMLRESLGVIAGLTVARAC